MSMRTLWPNAELADELVELAAHRCMKAVFSASRQFRQSLLYRRDWTVGLAGMKRPGAETEK
jgi:hypothetical protein